ncbi:MULTISPECIES: acylphosphatase [Bacillaceae]|uniref:Acylphosphatase n=1 Tax=Evansella alkalicola TaxID=745819 RepID=A0ABS6JX97_9BACI|nr:MULTISPECIES: acylphosphatase [Bacillaceae]MBU9722716.1 acylphosphatase [Bacillus alkalicola]
MQSNEVKWLPHLEGAVPTEGYGKKLSAYTIALEGWRRGLSLKFFTITGDENNLKYRYSLSNNVREHKFESSKGDKVSEEAFLICDNKHLTKEYLSKAGVPVPRGRRFEENVEDQEVINYAESLGFPLVLKPIDANGGKGVFANIKDISEFKEALDHVRHELNYLDVIVEEFKPGDEYRIIVLEERVIGALNRIPANVVGDGENTIKQLIDIKNKYRKNNPHLKSRPIKIDKELEHVLELSGYNLQSVPKTGERVFLRLTSNLSTGGDSVDITDELSPKLKEIAINATKAIPGLGVSGLDIIVNEDKTDGVVIEANTRPGFGGHLFPMIGEPRDLPKEIIDYYFPETKEVEKTGLYFDFDTILDPLKSRSVKELLISPAPLGKLYGRKIIISGKVQNMGYRKWIRKQVLNNNLHGYTECLDNGDLEVVITGPNKGEVKNVSKIIIGGNEKAEISGYKEEEWNKPVKIGFEIKKSKPEELIELEKELDRLETEKAKLNKKYTNIVNSRIWRYTSPVRLLLDNLKKIKND